MSGEKRQGVLTWTTFVFALTVNHFFEADPRFSVATGTLVLLLTNSSGGFKQRGGERTMFIHTLQLALVGCKKS